MYPPLHHLDKMIAKGLERGIKDQEEDFNKRGAEVIPASWTIQVDGRPRPQGGSSKAPATNASRSTNNRTGTVLGTGDNKEKGNNVECSNWNR